MIFYVAVVTDPKTTNCGKLFANTKSGPYKGLSKAAFYDAVKYNQVYSFEIREINDKNFSS